MEQTTPDRYPPDGLLPGQGTGAGGGTIWSSVSGIAGTIVVWIASAGVFSALAIAAGVIWLTWTLRTSRRK